MLSGQIQYYIFNFENIASYTTSPLQFIRYFIQAFTKSLPSLCWSLSQAQELQTQIPDPMPSKN